jgi:hypothetical protein
VSGSPGGGAIFVASGSAQVHNGLFLNNNMRGTTGILAPGSAIFASGIGPKDVAHNTIVITVPSPSSVIELTESAVILNNIVSGFYVGIEKLGSTGTVTENANLWHNVAVTGTANVQHGPIAITSDPRFVNPASGDFHLQSSSPAINTGATVSVTYDFDGQPRPVGGGFDIGYDEVPTVPRRVHLPAVTR